MSKGKNIYCLVTNDLNQDQRMHRICGSLQKIGYQPILIGRKKPYSPTLLSLPFAQVRLKCIFNKGFLFYAEYNLRLIKYLISHRPELVYAVDLDTIMPAVLYKKLFSAKVIFDAHEYFTEVPEIQHKPLVKKWWTWIENACVPQVDLAITVNQSLADIFSKKFNKVFTPIFNVPEKAGNNITFSEPKNYILYQGVLNEGRGLEVMIKTMELVPNIEFILAGEGDLSEKLRQMAQQSSASERIVFKGWQSPEALKKLTSNALLGVNILEGSSLNYYYSLANKFFDYIHAGVPSINMNFPEYKQIMARYDVGYLIEKLDEKAIANTILGALKNETELQTKRKNCSLAAAAYNWQHEESKLQNIMKQLD